MSSRSVVKSCVALVVAALAVWGLSVPALAAPVTPLVVMSFDGSGTSLNGMTFAGESCTRSTSSPAWQCQTLPSDVTTMTDKSVSDVLNDYVTMASPVGTSCTVAASDPSASLQKFRLWEVNAPQGYTAASGEISICYTETGWKAFANSSQGRILSYADTENQIHTIGFFNSKQTTPPTVIPNPVLILTGVCGQDNDGVSIPTSPDFTSLDPQWGGNKVWVTFKVNSGLNKVFENNDKVVTVTINELDTSTCASPTPEPPAPVPTTPVPPVPTTPVPTTPVPTTTPPPVLNELPTPKTSVKQRCGANNDRVRPAKSLLFVTKMSKWRKGRLKVTYTADNGYIFSNGESTKLVKTVRDKNRPCV